MTSSLPARKRGAPPDNKNALRHGLYARHYTGLETSELRGMPPLEPLQEISLIRCSLDRILTLIENCEDEDRKVKLYNTLFHGHQRLLATMRTQKVHTADANEILTDFWTALDLFQKERGL